MNSPLHLPTVTLCCLDTRMTAQAVYAMRQCMQDVRFGEALLLGSADARQHDLGDIRLEVVPELRSIEDYSRFMVHGLRHHLRTDHVLVVQWDGFVSNASRWRNEFLAWDYIGPPWYHGNTPGQVGNGGFSLRSRRLLDALANQSYDGKVPEDVAICVSWRAALEQSHGIQFAPVSLAEDFGVEYGPYRACFGFHGMHNFAHAMSPEALHQWLTQAPDHIISSQHTRKLIKELMRTGQTSLALELIQRRSQLTGWSRDHLNLYVRAHAHRVLRPFRPEIRS